MRFSALYLVFFALFVSPVAAGGVIGESGLMRAHDDEDNAMAVEEAAKGIKDGKPAGILPQNPLQPGGSISAVECGKTFWNPCDEAKPFFELQMGKTAAQSTIEQYAKNETGVDFSNICLTANGSCPAITTTRGSTCFCEFGEGLAIGYIQ
ncbi:hypothetical protein [Roseibium sp. RKSG952]|uniref:hypothetical protein n=1 Tax=Roseibium sp. RKSG952 TaxID=2529384 RepID=UPI0012BD51C7|nr:hypothetical protein [Roseibium sp. RKSG952]MTH95890.1 hypothetical protein [Roseibium sp. RKSG952]